MQHIYADKYITLCLPVKLLFRWTEKREKKVLFSYEMIQ